MTEHNAIRTETLLAVHQDRAALSPKQIASCIAELSDDDHSLICRLLVGALLLERRKAKEKATEPAAQIIPFRSREKTGKQ